MRCLAAITFCALFLSVTARAGDWPMYRADAARSGYTDESLAADLSLRWSYYPRHGPEPAWPRDERIRFDRAYHVAVANGLVFFGSSADCKVKALDATTGETRWSFFTDAPVRFAPAVWQNRVFAVSDDGHLYCLNAADGHLIKKWRGGPSDARVLGNGRIVSKWPARGGPVIVDGILHWAAGIWQSEGIYVRAMNLETGEEVWKNENSGSIDMPQPHGGANAVSGVTAQGYLLATANQLFVPTGRSVPAAFSRADGMFHYYRLQENGQRGGTLAMTAGPFLYNGGYAYETVTGQLSPSPVEGVVSRFPGGVIQGSRNRLRGLTSEVKKSKDRTGKPVERLDHRVLWQIDDVPAGTSLAISRNTIVSANGSRLCTVDLRGRNSVWTGEVDDTAYGLAIANQCLYVSTASGAIHCFGATSNVESVTRRSRNQDVRTNAEAAAMADEIIKQTGITEGYCVDLGCGDGALALELARRTDLHIVAIESDRRNVDRARRELDAAGLYGVRVTVHLGDPAKTHYPKYFANLVVSGRSMKEGADFVAAGEVRRLQRPFGGVACIGKRGQLHVSRRGPLENAGEWTHLYSDAANTLCSTDSIKGPLTVLWFRDVDLELPQRHGRGPSPLFRDGRIFAEGLDGLLAVDAYNGRPLWRYEIPDVLAPYDADHLAGSAVTGSNLCMAGSSLLVRYKNLCEQIDAATGKRIRTYEAPGGSDDAPVTWVYIAIDQGMRFGSIANQQHIVRHAYRPADSHMQGQFSESNALFAIDTSSGELLWQYDAEQSIRHNAIAVGGGRVFLIDRPLDAGDLLAGAEKRRGVTPDASETLPAELIALDVNTGKRLWSTTEDVFGTTLAYSEKYDRLLVFYQATRFKLPSEKGGRMVVHEASTGTRVWDQEVSYATRPLINDRTIVAYPTAVDLLTGEAKPLDFDKSYGCGQLSASQHLLLFRSATLGYFDLTRQAGTENYGGIRPGCWINVLPVGGLVLMPDASAGCRCSYQNRAWIALEGN